ncbi:hypothetical protein [Hyphobacterium sp.]|uniref:hypothetical protein n=1 Tax=Hyphobacterium sp. TaxID=2004662 RepID=UPI00374878CA
MLRLILIISALAVGLVGIGELSLADAQQRAVLRQTQTDTSFSPAFQTAMESGDYAQAAALVSSGRATGHRQHRAMTPSTSSSAATSLAANTPPPETADYTCNSGNCACAGASDCVAMAPICVEGTIGCNDYGCTCQEATG